MPENIRAHRLPVRKSIGEIQKKFHQMLLKLTGADGEFIIRVKSRFGVLTTM